MACVDEKLLYKENYIFFIIWELFLQALIHEIKIHYNCFRRIYILMLYFEKMDEEPPFIWPFGRIRLFLPNVNGKWVPHFLRGGCGARKNKFTAPNFYSMNETRFFILWVRKQTFKSFLAWK